MFFSNQQALCLIGIKERRLSLALNGKPDHRVEHVLVANGGSNLFLAVYSIEQADHRCMRSDDPLNRRKRILQAVIFYGNQQKITPGSFLRRFHIQLKVLPIDRHSAAAETFCTFAVGDHAKAISQCLGEPPDKVRPDSAGTQERNGLNFHPFSHSLR